MQVSDLMTPMTEQIDANATLRDAAIKMREDDIGALPVNDQSRLVGMITDRDIAMRAVADNLGSDAAVREIMSEGLAACFDDSSLEDCAHIMARHQVRRLPVINCQQRCVGFISLADLARSDDGGATLALNAYDGVTKPTPDADRA